MNGSWTWTFTNSFGVPTGPSGPFAGGGSFSGPTGSSGSFAGARSFGVPTGPSGPFAGGGSFSGPTGSSGSFAGARSFGVPTGPAGRPPYPVARPREHFIPVFLSNDIKLDDPADLIMPEFGLKLLPFIVPKKLRDNVTGDLREDFRTYAARWGRSYALRLLWWELAELCIRRFGPTAIVMAVGAWVRQKLGW